MPVSLVGGDPYGVAGAHPLRPIALLADEPVSRRDLQQLAVRMLMADRPPFRRENDGSDIHIVGLWKDRIEPDLTSGGAIPLRRQGLRVSSYDQQCFPLMSSGTQLKLRSERPQVVLSLLPTPALVVMPS